MHAVRRRNLRHLEEGRFSGVLHRLPVRHVVASEIDGLRYMRSGDRQCQRASLDKRKLRNLSRRYMVERRVRTMHSLPFGNRKRNTSSRE